MSCYALTFYDILLWIKLSKINESLQNFI